MPFSERMYKTKIRTWRLNKNNKRREMAAIVRIQRQREKADKKTRFRVRGRLVDLAKVGGYVKRRKQRQQASPAFPVSEPGNLSHQLTLFFSHYMQGRLPS